MTVRFNDVSELSQNCDKGFLALNADKLGIAAPTCPNAQFPGSLPAAKQNKYHNRKTYCQGVLYDSKKEAEKAAELELLKQACKIKGYLTQVSFRLPGGVGHRVDFGILNLDNTVTWLEIKGRDLAMGKMKRKQVEELYHIKIKVE